MDREDSFAAARALYRLLAAKIRGTKPKMLTMTRAPVPYGKLLPIMTRDEFKAHTITSVEDSITRLEGIIGVPLPRGY
jgi:hypothetical protein